MPMNAKGMSHDNEPGMDLSTDLADPTIQTNDHPERGRYEISVDGRLAGVSQYTLKAGVITLTHTEVGRAFDGRGLGSRLIADALDDARRLGRRVNPVCPFTARFIGSHPEYQDLVADASQGFIPPTTRSRRRTPDTRG